MELKFNTEIEINKDNPFENDALERKAPIEILSTLIEYTNKEMVISIDSEWGTGKTTFIKMWKQYLENMGYETLYFNAWESDFVDDPFIAFVNEFETILKEHPKLDKFVQVSKNVLKGIVPGVIKVATAGALDIDKIDFGTETEKTIIAYSEKLADDQIKRYRNTKNAMKEFRKVLVEFIESKVNDTGKPIVFFIDELDRCRPNFSVQLLEKLKHLFNIRGLIFILAIDKKELGNSIKAIYGHDMNVNGYLARFIDVEYTLPEPKPELYADFMYKRLELVDLYAKRAYDNGIEYNKTILQELIRVFGLTLRIQEKLFFRLVMVLNTTPKNHYLHEPLLTFLLCLKSTDLDLYYDICRFKISFENLKGRLDEYELLGKYFKDSNKYGPSVEGALMWVFNPISKIKDIRDKLEEYSKKIGNLNREEENEKSYLDYLLHVYNKFGGFGKTPQNVIPYLFKKIELCDSFKLNNT